MSRKLLFFLFSMMFFLWNITFVYSQQEEEVYLTVSPESIQLSGKGGEATITIKCNASFVWDIISSDDFFDAERVNNAIVVKTKHKNGMKEVKTGKIRIKSGDLVKDVVIVQGKSESYLRVKGNYTTLAFPIFGSVGYATKYWRSSLYPSDPKHGYVYGYDGVYDTKMVSGLRVGIISTDNYFIPKICGLGLHTGLFYQFYYEESELFRPDLNSKEDVCRIFQEHVATVPVHILYRLDFDDKGLLGMYVRAGLNFDFPFISLLYRSDEVDDRKLMYGTGNEYFKSLYGFNMSFGYAIGFRVNRFMLEYSGYRGMIKHSLNLPNDMNYYEKLNSDINFTLRVMMKDRKK